MSITVNLDDTTVARLERVAKATGLSVPQLIAQLVQRSGTALAAPSDRRAVLPPLPAPRAMGCLVDLTKANELADQLDSAERIGRMRRAG